MPRRSSQANGDYLGFDNKVHKATGFQYYTDFSLWDTFRTAHPLYTLIAPKDQRDMIMSLIKMLEQGGWLPRWPSGHGYSNSMEGTPADIMITDSYLKGIRDFDVEKAYQAMRLTALGPTPKGAAFSGREGVTEYLKYGYCPTGLISEKRGPDLGILLGRLCHLSSRRSPWPYRRRRVVPQACRSSTGMYGTPKRSSSSRETPRGSLARSSSLCC